MWIKMDAYIKYHRKPYAKYLDVAAFNAKFNTNVVVHASFDQEFYKKYSRLRKMAHDEYIAGNLNVEVDQDSLPMSLEEAVDKQNEIEEIVLERAKDKNSGELDLKNIIHFNNNTDVRERLMKGTKKNIEKLRNYVNGVDDYVRMSYRKNNKEVRISDLKPNIESLKAFLNDMRNIREVKCV